MCINKKYGIYLSDIILMLRRGGLRGVRSYIRTCLRDPK